MTPNVEKPGEAATNSSASDWSRSYSQLLARSAAHSAKTLKLYQQALEYVSQGKLAPDSFQNHFPQFAQTHGADYTKKLAGINAKFFSDLVQLSRSVAREGANSPPEPEIAPPRFDTANPARWYEEIAEYAGQLNARALKAYRAQLDKVAAGDVTPSEAQQATSEYLAKNLPEYLQHLAQLYFGLLNGLNDVRAEYEENYFRGLLGEQESVDVEPPVLLDLTGTLGATVSSSLSLTNTTAERIAVHYRIGDVRRANGEGPAFDPKLTITPEDLELDPDEEGTVTLSLLLDKNQYDPDALYVGGLFIESDGDLRVEVHLRITAAAVKASAKRSKGSA